MYRFFNPNPRGKSVGDCTVRAVCGLLNLSWDDAYDLLCDQGRIDADMPDANAVMVNLLKKLGFRKRLIPDELPEDYTLSDFAIDHPCGRYLVAFGTHVVAVVSGDFFDSFDSSGEHPIYFFEEV